MKDLLAIEIDNKKLNFDEHTTEFQRKLLLNWQHLIQVRQIPVTENKSGLVANYWIWILSTYVDCWNSGSLQ